MPRSLKLRAYLHAARTLWYTAGGGKAMDNERRHFSYLARYNRSANEAMVAHLAALDMGELAAPRGSYFGSI
jgi:hypothetical protein